METVKLSLKWSLSRNGNEVQKWAWWKNSTIGRSWQICCISEYGTMFVALKIQRADSQLLCQEKWGPSFPVIDQACRKSTDQLYSGPLNKLWQGWSWNHCLNTISKNLKQCPFQCPVVQAVTDNKIQCLPRRHATLAKTKQKHRLARII